METSLFADLEYRGEEVIQINRLPFQINYVSLNLSMQLIEIGPRRGSFLARIGHTVRLPGFCGFVCHWSD